MRRVGWMALGAALLLALSSTALAGSEATTSPGEGASCGLETVKGTYAVHATGFLAGQAFAAVGTWSFDGTGGISGTLIENTAGTMDGGPFKGTYELAPDCTGVALCHHHHERKTRPDDDATVDIVVGAGGRRVMGVLSDIADNRVPAPRADDASVVLSGYLERM